MAAPAARMTERAAASKPKSKGPMTGERYIASLKDRREVWIDHAGVRYRLRITRRNKLILQK